MFFFKVAYGVKTLKVYFNLYDRICIISGAIANALTFIGSQVGAKALGDDGGPIKEVKRHNKALESIQKAQAEYKQKRAESIDKMNARLDTEGAATRRLNMYVEARRLYIEVFISKGR